MGQSRSRSVQIAPPAKPASTSISSKLALGAGCYWGTESYVRRKFQQRFPKSIKNAAVGFMSPQEGARVENPTYQQVCSGIGTHIEVLYVELNEPEKHFEELVRFFFQFHDPTTPLRQGNDRGFQYASWIFCGDEEQSEIASRVRDELQQLIDAKAVTCFAQKKISTKITPLRHFTPAHDEHQQYLEKNVNGYCNHRIRFKEWPMLAPSQTKTDEPAEK